MSIPSADRSRFVFDIDVLRVVDGDTLDVVAATDAGFGVYTAVNVRVRLANVDTPEIYSVKHDSPEFRMGMEAKTAVELWLHGRLCAMETHKTGKFGRWVAVVWDRESGETLNQYLRGLGHGDG